MKLYTLGSNSTALAEELQNERKLWRACAFAKCHALAHNTYKDVRDQFKKLIRASDYFFTC